MGDPVRSRQMWYTSLQRLQVAVNALDPDTITPGRIDSCIEQSESMWKKIDEAHAKCLQTAVDDAAGLVQMQTLEPMQDCFASIKEVLYNLRKTTAATAKVRHLRLPDMQLPSFEGKYEEWPSFSDLFLSTVHNNATLTSSQKLQYLKTVVKGEAAALIRSFTITDANYREAWQLLEEHYDNQREIINSLVKRLLFQPNIKTESALSLQELLNVTMETIRSLKVLGRPTDSWDDLIIVSVVEKLDTSTKSEWAKSLKGTQPSTLKGLQEFILQHIRTLHARGVPKLQNQSNKTGQQSNKRIHSHQPTPTFCHFCKGTHQLYQCQKLKDMSPDKRFEAVKATKACLNCLRQGHSVKDCSSTTTCKTCSKKHNTFLHDDSIHKPASSSNGNNSSSSANNQSSKININSTAMTSQCTTILKTALVNVQDRDNAQHQLRVFLDDGGEGGLIQESTMFRLGLPRTRVNMTISGVGDVQTMRSKWKTNVRLHSQHSNTFVDVELYAVPTVTGPVNKGINFKVATWPHLADLQLADPSLHKGGKIDILLGADTVPYILQEGLRKGEKNAPVAQNTMFGWVLFGRSIPLRSSPVRIHSFKCDISETLRRFWEIESVPSEPVLTQEERQCELHFTNTHQRQPDGRYMVRLPFNENLSSLGSSRDQALRRLFSLEKRFRKQPDRKEAYIQFMREYESLGHMEKITTTQPESSANYYLPHHYVLKEDSSTTKQRTVFDGSAKSSTGFSLNDAMMVGATVQPSLYTLLLRFRYNKIALKADINKMYRQFSVHPDDINFQRIVWRERETDPVMDFKLTTVTYGTASAPFLATRCLNQLAEDEGSHYPRAAAALRTSFYVDDLLQSTSSPVEAVATVNELMHITASAGMEIRKWCSNCPDVLRSIPSHLIEDSAALHFDNNNEGSSIKALGLKWNPTTDTFEFSVHINNSKQVTKRTLLSEVSKTFDPLGWLSPITITAKILLQKVWIEGKRWDDELFMHLQEEWNHYKENLQQVEHIKIPRCIIYSTPVSVELYGFSDSSELAYSSALYVRCIYPDKSVSVNLLTSKTRVAPIKSVSLPKLELCGASLLAETVNAVKNTFDYDVAVHCYTDSTITLRWITSHSRRWKTFVANRVSVIQSSIPPSNWHFVRGQENPADLPSRGFPTSQWANSDLWWHGPSWLQHGHQDIIPNEIPEEEVLKEEKQTQLIFNHLASREVNKLFSAFSSFAKLCRIAAYIIRYIKYLKTKSIYSTPWTGIELTTANHRLIKWAQADSFSKEITSLRNHNKVSCSSKLVNLHPFLDNDGILRVGGRLQKSQLPASTRHPIILCHDHPITKLIISDTHITTLHGGFNLTLSILRRKYWILRSRDSVRNFIRKCIICRKSRAQTTTQLMGSLPKGRVTPNRPFLHAGVDFAGPFQIKHKKGRHFQIDKAYFCIFVCLSTKAVHLEAVSSLSSQAFIACYERFVSRRGVSAYLYSDCGTNFVGADRILKEFLLEHQAALQISCVRLGTTWCFNPPSSPHQGGLWEAGVKSVKYHFRRVVGQQILLFEQFQTLLCKIEGCLNSRPLCALSADPFDFDALTPGHFLIGEPITNIPEPDLTHINENRLDQWEVVRQKTQHFWKRWHMEYLTSLQQRHKWTEKRDNLQVGDLVVIADDQVPVARWKLGRILLTHPGADGLVRSATVKTTTGEIRRPNLGAC